MLMYVVTDVMCGLRVYDKSQTHIFQQHVICVYTSVVKMGRPRPFIWGGIREPVVVGSY